MGTSKTKILDRRDFDSDIYTMIDEAVNWVLSKINVEYIINDVRREERPELPISAIREAVINAVVHRNYRSSANIHIYLFSDRLEIRSPGGLPFDMPESDLGTGSVPRNPLLFSVLHRMEVVEHIGSGIRRIRDQCREYMVAEPLFTNGEHVFTVTFSRSTSLTYTEEFLPHHNQSLSLETQPNSSLDVEGTKLDVEGTKLDVEGTKLDAEGTKLDAEGTKLDLTGDQIEIIQRCEHEKTASELMEGVGRTNQSKFRQSVLKPLIHAELIEMTVPDRPRSRNQKYLLTQKGKKLLYHLQ